MKKIINLVPFIAVFALVGCNPRVDPIQTIEPSQTAFLVPLEGQTSNQGNFNSEAFLEQSKVASKRITIPQRQRSLGNMPWDYEWIPTMRLIVVERKPESRHWVGKEGIVAESKESIGFSTGIACTAQIDENDAAKFLYRYNSKPLAEVMDAEVLNRIRSKFVELCATYNLSDLLINKAAIMTAVRNDVVPYFKEKGVNITSLGLVGELNYLDDGIQASINKKFQAQQELVAQTSLNQKTIEKAKADEAAAKILDNPNVLALKRLEIQQQFLSKWNGETPKVTGGGNTLLNVDSLIGNSK
jgi:SPFH domain / Band 7 family